MSFTNSDRYNRDRMSSSCSYKSEDSDFDLDDGTNSFTNSSSGFSRMNSTYSSSTYSLNDKRRSRNQNEKKRRDQFNLLIQELGNLLNHPRKIDKATVLSETLFFFRNYNEKPLYNKEIEFKFKPFFLQNDEFMRFMIEFQNAFCLVFDLNGDIKYVSDDIIHLMGHSPKNLQNCSIYDFIDEKSVKKLKVHLKRKFNPLDSISFDCKFKKINDSNGGYEPVRIKGFFKRTPNSVDSLGHFNTIAKLDSFMSINELYPRDNNKREFKTEFSMDLKYTSLDSKATEMIGYSPIEIIGTCGYDYCHLDDLEKLIECHKKLLQNGAVPLIAYRFRTKGLQWLWIQSRFQILYHQTAMKPYAIVAHNHVITLNEMIESKDLLDANSFTSSAQLANKIEPETKQEPDAKAIHWSTPNETEEIDTKQPAASLSIPVNKPEHKPDKHIDDSLGSIFLRSFNDIDYRNYVLNQFKLKKQKIENTLRKHQEELKILEETMDNIRDEKKLASWVMEFQRQEYDSNLYKNNQGFSNKSQKSEAHSSSYQSPIQSCLNSLSPPPQQQQQQSVNYQSQKNQMRQSQFCSNELLVITGQMSDNMNQSQYQMDMNKKNSLLMPKPIQNNRNYLKSESLENENVYKRGSLETNENKSIKRSYSGSPSAPMSRNEFNEEAELVGQLLNIRKSMPKTSNETKNDNDFNNNNNKMMNSSQRSKSTLQQSLPPIDIDDLNPEMLEKIFNYNFDSFPNQ